MLLRISLRRPSIVTAAFILVTALSTSGAQADKTKSDKDTRLKVAFIYPGSIKDTAWNQRSDETGRQALEKFYGDKIETTYVQNVNIGPPVAQTVNRLVRQGYKLFFLNTAGYDQYLAPIAKAHPDVRFEQLQSAYTDKNYGSLNINMVQGTYITGMMLGFASKTGRIGTVQSFPYSGIINQVNGFALGAKAANPNATTRVIFISSFNDPAKTALAAQSLVDAGIDALAMDDGTGCIVAEKANVPCVSMGAYNGPTLGPNTFFTATYYNLEPLYRKVVDLTLAGQPVPTSIFMGWKEGAIGMTPLTPAYSKWVSEADRAKVQATQTALANGSLDVYGGPLSDQNGKLRVPEGKSLTTDEILSIDWAVQGVTGEVKPGSK